MHKEDQLVEKIAKAARFKAVQHRGVRQLRLGIGDDATILSPGGRSDWVVTCDAFLEGVHFIRNLHPPDSVGYKSLVRATSDIVAMGASPRYFLMTLAIPASHVGTWLDGFLSGLDQASRELHVQLIGGDTTKHNMIFVNMTVLGEAPRGHALTRAGARPGDLIYVTGKLGGAELGLKLLRNRGSRRDVQNLLRPHLYPRIDIELGAFLARKRVANAMMDISDGLSTDLARLCSASRVGARIAASKIPRVNVPGSASNILKTRRLDPLQLALHGGDDYALLFTVSPWNVKKLRHAPGFANLACIGTVTSGRKIALVDADGTESMLEARGWDPFRVK